MSVPPVRVLLIDDDESSFIITRELFEERYAERFELDWAGSFEKGLEAIRQARHDVYLVDQRLGGRDGLDLLKAASAAGCRAPMIVLTGQDSREIDVAAMQAGAADYVIKDVYDISRLEHAMRYALERQRLQAALEHERDLLRALMENLPDSIFFKDAQSRFLRISQSKALWSGLNDPAQALGKTDFDFFAREDAQSSFSDEQEVMRSGQPLVGKEEKHVWPDGRESWVVTTKLPLRDKQDNVIGTFGISHDITEQKLALQALRDSEFRTRQIVETALDAFVGVDCEGTIIDWNAQAANTFGWQHEEALGQPLAQLIIPPRFRAAQQEGMQRFLLTSQTKILGQRLELIALHRDGREFPVEVTISALRLGGEVLFASFIHDITKRKAVEAALREAKDAAEAASRAKSDFLANMSHEIRTPMNAIMGMTELVIDTELSPSQREYLTMVRESGESLLHVINDILDFSKIEAGKLDLILDVFNVRETLGDTMKSLAVRAHRTNLEMAFRVANDVPDALVGDAGRLRQIVVNLIGNAIKFTHQGEVVLEVSRAEPHSGGDGEFDRGGSGVVSVTPMIVLHFSVRDTGIGISETKQSVIFEAFEQADSSTTRKYGGTGLGLAISKRLVELMGGRIWVESQEGVGSTFHFSARFVVPPPSADLPSAKTIVMHGTRVLVVDDNATNRLILEEILRNWGLSPICADSASQAMHRLHAAQQENEPFSIVLSDLHMPVTDGFMLAEAIRREPRLARTLILILTSGERQGDVAKCRQLGVSAYLLKPVKQSELFNALVAALGVNSPEDQVTLARPAAVGGDLPSLRILLAEDSLANQKLAVGLLTKWGHHVTLANNGVETVELWSTPPDGRSFDVVLMDVQMPEMDGFEATAEIRERERASGRHTPIVAMTAHAMKGDRDRCLLAGMDGYVAKPIRQQELIAVLQESVVGQIGGTPRTPIAETRPTEMPTLNVTNSKLLNWAKALEAVGHDRELLDEVLKAFLEEGPDLLSRMRDAVSKEDWSVVAKLSHTLQAALRMFDGPPLESAVSLEDRCKRGLADESRSRFAKFQEELENVFTEVRSFLQSP